MSRIVYYKIFAVILFSFSDIYLYGKLLRPVRDRDQKEILVINSKRRVYYPIKEGGLLYNVSGPTRAEFISRYPVLRGKKKSHSHDYAVGDLDIFKCCHSGCSSRRGIRNLSVWLTFKSAGSETRPAAGRRPTKYLL